jgi:NADPH2:quinone reductase
VRAALVREHGGPSNVELADVDPPTLGVGQIRVGVYAAAVNFPDVLVAANTYQVKVPAPFVLGSEFAGKVLEVADGVDRVQVGDHVAGSALYGCFAEQVVVSASAVYPMPAEVPLDIAAAFGVAHRTAYHSLRSVAKVKAGDELVVLGAGGGVGLAAVQLGHALGATVTAVASSNEKLDAARSVGADRTINYRETDLRAAVKEQVPGGADVVIDPVGGAVSEPALRGLRYEGRFVTVGYAAGEIPRIPLNLVLLKGITIVGFEYRSWAGHYPEDLVRNDAELVELLLAGQATPYIGARFDLADAAAAVQHVADGKATGKVLLEIGANA